MSDLTPTSSRGPTTPAFPPDTPDTAHTPETAEKTPSPRNLQHDEQIPSPIPIHHHFSSALRTLTPPNPPVPPTAPATTQQHTTPSRSARTRTTMPDNNHHRRDPFENNPRGREAAIRDLEVFNDMVDDVGVADYATGLKLTSRQVSRMRNGAQCNPVNRFLVALQAATPAAAKRTFDYILTQFDPKTGKMRDTNKNDEDTDNNNE